MTSVKNPVLRPRVGKASDYVVIYPGGAQYMVGNRIKTSTPEASRVVTLEGAQELAKKRGGTIVSIEGLTFHKMWKLDWFLLSDEAEKEAVVRAGGKA